MHRIHIPIFLLAITGVFICPGCGKIKGMQFPYIESPRVIVSTPASPASGDISVIYQLIDRELEQGSVVLEYSTDGGQTYNTATLTIPGEATNLASAWHPGTTHTVAWDSVTDMVGRSGAVSVCVKITPSDASNPAGTAGVSDTFTVNNIAYNQPPSATVTTPAGIQLGNIPINYFLSDAESDTCSIAVLYSTNDGTSWQATTMGTAGNGLTGISSSPAGTAHVYFWDSQADNVAPSGQLDTVRIRITPTDFNVGTAGDTNSFSMDNSIANDPPTVTITGGPAEGSTVATTQVMFTWNGSDTDGSVIGYYYSFDQDPPDVWTTDTTVTSSVLSEATHVFRIVAMDDDSDLSTVASRSFTISIPGTITAQFSGSPLTGTAPLDVSFTDLSTATNGINTWSWAFGDGGTSSQLSPIYQYTSGGSYTVSLTVTGPDGSDTETKTNYITVTAPSGDTIYVDGTNGLDTNTGLTWGTAVKTIQIGLDKASDDWMVLVANGTYTGGYNRDLKFYGKSIHLTSESGASSCTINCENLGRGFYLYFGGSSKTVIEGFTIENGSGSVGAGAIGCGSSSPTITKCIIRNCSAGKEGGAISCRISSNPTITNCTITGCSAPQFGGGIYCFQSSPTITNCTITGNSCDGEGGGIYCNDGSGPTFNSCIIWGNSSATDTGNEIYTNDTGSFVNLNYCDYSDDSGDVVGSGTVVYNSCITLPPLFVGSGDYHLQAGSPCIDAGDNSLIPPGVTTDLDGNERIFNGTVDIGAYEYGSSPPPPQYGWTRVAGDDSDEVGYDIATDQSGNIYVTGHFGGTVDFGTDFGASDNKVSQGQSDVFIMKIASNGAYGWTRVAGSLSVDVGHAVIVSPLGGVYATGHFRGTVDFGADFSTSDSKTSVGGGDIFIMKVNADGSYGWTKAMTGGTYSYGYGIAADLSGNLYVTGIFEETVDFGADFGTPDSKIAQGDDDVFITKINADDSYGWTKTMGGGMLDIGTDVTVDGSGNIYIVGYFEGTVDFGADFGTSDSKISQGAYDVFITKIGSGGTYSWTRRIGGTGFDRAYDIAVGSSDGVYATGYFVDTVDFGADFGTTDTKTSNGSGDIFITKVNADGSYCWSKVIGSTGYDEGNSIATDQSGGVYATGRFESTVNFGADFGQSDSKTSQGDCDIFVIKIASDGTYGWSKAMGGAWYDYGFGIASDSSGNVITTGRFELTVDFGADFGTSDSKTSVFGSRDMFVTKIKSP